jgi:hypothetical protein
MTIYVDLTREFNRGRFRAVICSDQAVVLHRLAIMSKDGDWILREDAEALGHVLEVLESHGARYRFGAPLDVDWMRGGWSAHFEFRHESLRVRTDFFTRPPRVSAEQLSVLWERPPKSDPPFTDAVLLAQMKLTDRERDYAVIGELARIMPDPADRLRFSRSARELTAMSEQHPELVRTLAAERPLLKQLGSGLERVEVALDAERRSAMRSNQQLIAKFRAAAETWAARWPALVRQLEGLPLREAHNRLVQAAAGVIPVAISP